VLDIEQLIDDVSATGKLAFAITDVEEIVRALKRELQAGDVVAIMSNGGFGGIHEKLIAQLQDA
jgi:UDP-N-acetylmuramate: L-alanyl-gamma-D-glutamyl-meso-diaminopimelate ligase